MNRNYISLLEQLLSTQGWTQPQLAARLGVTFAALNRWLQGHATPQPSRITAIEALYKTLVGYPAITKERVDQAIRQAQALRKKRLWAQISSHNALQDDLVLEHTYNSTSIEGTTFTKRQTEGVIFHKATISNKPLIEHLEVSNHAAVLKNIFQQKHLSPLSEALIQEIHKGLLLGIRDDAGHYSKHPRAIRGVTLALTHPADIPEEMALLIKAWNRKPAQKTISDIARFHSAFELIHPFGDGNGRTGRLLMVIQCLQTGHPPVIIENTRKIDYYEVLEYAQKKDEGPFICFLADEMSQTQGIIKKYL